MQPIFDIDAFPSRILIVDSDGDGRRALEGPLAAKGHELLLASTAGEALAAVAHDMPDLILLALTVPGVDSQAIVDSVKANPATTNIPIIMLASVNSHTAIMRGLNAGAEDFVATPVNETELLARVGNQLRLRAHVEFQEQCSQMLAAVSDERAADLVARVGGASHRFAASLPGVDATAATGDEDGSNGVFGIGRRARQQRSADREDWIQRAPERRRARGE